MSDSDTRSSCASAGSCDKSSCEGCPSANGGKPDFSVPMNSQSNIRHVIGIVSGKGGVGKSLITSASATLMRKAGKSVGILDADVTGPSIPTMYGVKGPLVATPDGSYPAVAEDGTKVMSINLLLDTEDTPVIWRGPVIAGVIKQFWEEVIWGDIDYLFVDMPPGTGDVPLTVFQSLPLDGIIIVTSPQELVELIVTKAFKMASMMDVPVFGLVENYSYIVCPDCGKHISVFGESRIEEVSSKFNVPVLAKLPMDPSFASLSDSGRIFDMNTDNFKDLSDMLGRLDG